jgi:hypothetical protein
MAGGSALACLQPLPTDLQSIVNSWFERIHILSELSLLLTSINQIVRYLMENDPIYFSMYSHLYFYYHGVYSPYKKSDLDLFILANSQKEAEEKVYKLVRQIRRNIPCKSFLVRTLNSVTIMSEMPNRNVQIIIILVCSVEELLFFFDIDCCTVAFDGQSVLVHERCQRALNTLYNFLSPTMWQRENIRNRAAKYGTRGLMLFYLKYVIIIHDVMWSLIRLHKVGKTWLLIGKVEI